MLFLVEITSTPCRLYLQRPERKTIRPLSQLQAGQPLAPSERRAFSTFVSAIASSSDRQSTAARSGSNLIQPGQTCGWRFARDSRYTTISKKLSRGASALLPQPADRRQVR
jgi:hypothetical protein